MIGIGKLRVCGNSPPLYPCHSWEPFVNGRRQIVDFIRLNLLHKAHHIAAIGHIAIAQKQANIFFAQIDVNIINKF